MDTTYKLLMNVLFPLVVVPGTVMDVAKKSRRIKFHLQINYNKGLNWR